jgi:RHS repeat-associated protein
MVATYQRHHPTGPHTGRAQKRLASHVWGPDLASRLEARRDWQAAGGVGGLLMTLYPVTQSGSSPTYEAWLASQGVYPGTQIGYYDFNQGMWVQYTGEYTEPFYDENNNWISEGAGFYTPYGFLVDYDGMLEAYGYDYASYAQAVGNHLIHVPVMDHMGNVTSVVRLSATPGAGSSSQTEFLYDYDAFGKEIRSTALLPGSNPDHYPFHYSTKFTDAETGLVYYGYRFYDPANGRWINRDPIGEEGGLNLCGMVGNCTLISFDILGLCELENPCKKEQEAAEELMKKHEELEAGLDEAIKTMQDAMAGLSRASNATVAGGTGVGLQFGLGFPTAAPSYLALELAAQNNVGNAKAAKEKFDRDMEALDKKKAKLDEKFKKAMDAWKKCLEKNSNK